MENKPIGNIGTQFEEIGGTLREVRENIPHIKVGKEGQPESYSPFVEKMRKWLLIILVFLIGGTATILIVWRILTRVF